jgi:hypothetical protein
MLNVVPTAGVLNFVIPALSAGLHKTFAWTGGLPVVLMASKIRARRALTAEGRARPVHAPKIQSATTAILVRMMPAAQAHAPIPTMGPAVLLMEDGVHGLVGVPAPFPAATVRKPAPAPAPILLPQTAVLTAAD